MSSRTDQARSLLYHARGATPFCSENGQPCAVVPSDNGARSVYPLRSAAFRDWLTSNFYKEFEIPPSAAAFRAALRTLEAQARYTDFPARRINQRIAFEGDPLLPSKIIIDLANTAGEILEITSRGWSVQENFHYAFRQSTSSFALPYPVSPDPDRGETTEASPLVELQRLLRLDNDESWHCVLAWLTAALRPAGPYPILVLSGPAGSGKSFLARALRFLIDPVAAPIHRIPPRDHDLLQLACHNWILVFDLVHRLPSKISDALCAISSGDALEITQPDLRDPIVFQVARPMILIAPQDETQHAWTPSRTLRSRTLAITLDHIARPRPESAIWSSFEAIHPAAFGALSDAVATALRRIRNVDLGNVPRFPDCAAWTAAAAPALGIDDAAVTNAFAQPNSFWTGSDPLREAIYAVLRPTGTWSGETADLLNQLRAAVPLASLPSTPKGLSQALPSIAGIRVTRTRNETGQRILTITKVLDASQKFASILLK